MIDAILRALVWGLLSLRYRVRVRGIEAVASRGRRSILFLPNHPALIDPVILLAALHNPFAARALADREQVDRFGIRHLARRAGVMTIPDTSQIGMGNGKRILASLEGCAAALRQGDNVILYPAGRILRCPREELGGNSGVELLLRQLNGGGCDVRIVLVRTRGLWGSRFGFAPWGGHPGAHLGRTLRRGALALLASGVFFLPRREVTIELVEPDDFPRHADRHTINRYLEQFYNAGDPAEARVPYSLWHRGRNRQPI